MDLAEHRAAVRGSTVPATARKASASRCGGDS